MAGLCIKKISNIDKLPTISVQCLLLNTVINLLLDSVYIYKNVKKSYTVFNKSNCQHTSKSAF